MFSIVLYHPAGRKVRGYRADRLLHDSHPTLRNTAGITFVESRDNSDLFDDLGEQELGARIQEAGEAW